jgi:hypothetical protein
MFNEKEKQEADDIAVSESLRDDMRLLRKNRHNPFLKDGQVDIDAYIDFLNQYNEFINHAPKPFKPIIDRIMKL